MRKLIFLVAALSLTSSAHAQRSPTPPAAPQPPGGVYTRIGIVDADVVKGAPYSADVVTESAQILSDGNRIFRRQTSRVYRDTEGRTRREIDRPNRSPEITISDPAASKSWTLDIENRTAIERPRSPGVLFNSGWESREAFTAMLNGQVASLVARGANGGLIVGGPAEQSSEERLTPKTIEGLRVEGIRRTSTIPAGAIGNERAIMVTSEQWDSPELKVQVLSESSDPRTGTSTYKLVNLKRADPPASLFQVPADFTVTQPPAGRGVGVRGSGGRQ